MSFNGNIEDLKYMKRSCGKIKLLLQGGEQTKSSKEFLEFICPDFLRKSKNKKLLRWLCYWKKHNLNTKNQFS